MIMDTISLRYSMYIWLQFHSYTCADMHMWTNNRGDTNKPSILNRILLVVIVYIKSPYFIEE